jgi:hypothetical protein
VIKVGLASKEDVMDSIILAALITGITSITLPEVIGKATAEVIVKAGENPISAAYNKLKKLLVKKLGADSSVVKAVKECEANPTSEARKAVLKEEVTRAKADEDADLVSAAQALLKVIKAQPGGEQIVQTAMGDQNIQIAGKGNTVSVNTPKTKRS